MNAFWVAISLSYRIPQRNYQLNDFKWNRIRIWWFLCLLLFLQYCCQFQSLTVDEENKRRVFCCWAFLLVFQLDIQSYCAKLSEMKGNENNEISEKQYQLLFSLFFCFKKFFYSRSFFNFVVMKKFEGFSSIIWVKCESYGRWMEVFVC